MKEINDKVNMLYKRISELEITNNELKLKVNSIKLIVGSGMNDTQKIGYIKEELKEE